MAKCYKLTFWICWKYRWSSVVPLEAIFNENKTCRTLTQNTSRRGKKAHGYYMAINRGRFSSVTAVACFWSNCSSGVMNRKPMLHIQINFFNDLPYNKILFHFLLRKCVPLFEFFRGDAEFTQTMFKPKNVHGWVFVLIIFIFLAGSDFELLYFPCTFACVFVCSALQC